MPADPPAPDQVPSQARTSFSNNVSVIEPNSSSNNRNRNNHRGRGRRTQEENHTENGRGRFRGRGFGRGTPRGSPNPTHSGQPLNRRGRGTSQANPNTRSRPQDKHPSQNQSDIHQQSADNPALSQRQSQSEHRSNDQTAQGSGIINPRINGFNQRADSSKPNQRRKGFGSRLTESQSTESSHTPGTPLQNQVEAIDTSKLSLSARLTIELQTAAYDCLICIATVTPHQPTYQCPNCFAIFHLSCSSKWASCSVVDTSNKARLLQDRDGIPCSEEAAKGEWRCPGCQHKHIGKETVPQRYFCWCGKVENPTRRQRSGQHPQSSSIPHGCGNKCLKVAAEGCVHGCEQECHPGSCEPCAAVIKTRCHCQKIEKAIRCSQLHTSRKAAESAKSELLSCGQTCNKKLACGFHQCDRPCHSGDCGRCEVIRDKKCYCGQAIQADQQCSEMVVGEDLNNLRPQKKVCFSSNGVEWIGEFSCKSQCPWLYDCDIHQCESRCHPHLSVKPLPCTLAPALLKTCPCGTTPLDSRIACTDPISTCFNPCRKPLPSCGHPCSQKCHLGACGPCVEFVTTVCRCGKDQIVRKCTELELLRQQALAENSKQPQETRQDTEVVAATAVEFQCERVCRVLRHCGKHSCNRRCCPLAFLEGVLLSAKGKKSQLMRHHEQEDQLGLHLCDLICNKKLSCGLHTCQLRDHKGPCPTCLQASFDELICHCGATIIQPPVPCGTEIHCNRPCIRPPPTCGHPKAPHLCHENPECPPCPFLTNKQCQCDKNKFVSNVRCSQLKVSCGQTCGKLLSCGAHRCNRKCHPTGQCEACDQACLKPRKHWCVLSWCSRALCQVRVTDLFLEHDSGHQCQLKCHAPSVCSTGEPCKSIIDIKCACGRISQQVQCSSCDSRPEGNCERIVKCNNDCILQQRNAALASALEISSPVQVENEPEIEWSEGLLQFYAANTLFSKYVETQFSEFINSKQSKSTHVIHSHSEIKRAFVYELAAKYRLRFESVEDGPRFGVKLTRVANSALPQPLLSVACGKTQTSKLTPLPSRGLLFRTDLGMPSHESANTVRMNAILLEAVFGHDENSLRALLDSAFGNTSYSLMWVKDEDVALTINLAASNDDSINRTSPNQFSDSTLESKLNSLYMSLTALLDQVSFCKSICLIRLDSTGKVIARKPISGSGSWKSINRAPSRWQLDSNDLKFTNTFDALSFKSSKKHTEIRNTTTKPDPWFSGGIIGGGFNRRKSPVFSDQLFIFKEKSNKTKTDGRPSSGLTTLFKPPSCSHLWGLKAPKAVLAPIASTSRIPISTSQAEIEVVDDWEQELNDD